MNNIATIGYTSNLYARDQKTINYFEFQAMLAAEVSDCLYWYASIHPRETDNATLEASERLSLCVQSRLSKGERVTVFGGDVSGLLTATQWLPNIRAIGVEGISSDELIAMYDIAFNDQTDKKDCDLKSYGFVNGFQDHELGVWWPREDNHSGSLYLPPSLRILYVPEIEEKKHMLILLKAMTSWAKV